MNGILEIIGHKSISYEEACQVDRRLLRRVSHADKDMVERMGARWNGLYKFYAIPTSIDSSLFLQWMDTETRSVHERIYLEIPEKNEEMIKDLCLERDATLSKWFIRSWTSPEILARIESFLPKPDIREQNFYLDLPMDEKEEGKKLGARWDSEAKQWFAPAGKDITPFKQWFPGVRQASGRTEQRVYISVSREESAEVKKLGAWWDAEKKLWYYRPSVNNPANFLRWPAVSTKNEEEALSQHIEFNNTGTAPMFEKPIKETQQGGASELATSVSARPTMPARPAASAPAPASAPPAAVSPEKGSQSQHTENSSSLCFPVPVILCVPENCKEKARAAGAIECYLIMGMGNLATVMTLPAGQDASLVQQWLPFSSTVSASVEKTASVGIQSPAIAPPAVSVPPVADASATTDKTFTMTGKTTIRDIFQDRIRKGEDFSSAILSVMGEEERIHAKSKGAWWNPNDKVWFAGPRADLLALAAFLPFYLQVPMEERDAAKAVGAKWDAAAKKWFVKGDVPLNKIARWLAAGTDMETQKTEDKKTQTVSQNMPASATAQQSPSPVASPVSSSPKMDGTGIEEDLAADLFADDIPDDVFASMIADNDFDEDLISVSPSSGNVSQQDTRTHGPAF